MFVLWTDDTSCQTCLCQVKITHPVKLFSALSYGQMCFGHRVKIWINLFTNVNYQYQIKYIHHILVKNFISCFEGVML